MSKLQAVAQRFDDAQKISDAEWQARCPSCGNDNGLLSITTITPQWINVQCPRCTPEEVLAKKGLKPDDLMPGPGKIGSPARKVGVTEADHVKGLLPHHLKELRASGLTDDTIEAAGIYSETRPAKLRTILEWDRDPKKLCPAIIYPYDADGNYCRAKPDKPRTIKKSKVKYESPRGRGNRLYIPAGAKASVEDPQTELIITEGEKKALAGTQVGIATIGLVGVHGWKVKNSEKLIPAILEISWRDRDVFIVFDSDIDTKPGVQDAEARLAKLLTDRGAFVRCGRLPDGEPDKEGLPTKIGLDDYLLSQSMSIEALRKLLDEAIDPPAVEGDGVRDQASEADPDGEATSFIASGKIDEVSPLRFWQGGFLWWSQGRYREVHTSEIRSRVIEWMNMGYHHLTTSVTNNIMDQVKAKCLLPFGHEAPCWIGDGGGWSPRDLIVTRNGIVNLARLSQNDPDYMRPATPRFFTTAALDYDFDISAPKCENWLAFLNELWDADDEKDNIKALQEWFGYCLAADTSLQKIGLFIGPPRSGKGTIARVLRAVIGDHNVAGPTLASFATNFGLWPLVGKLLAIVSDARLGGRSDQAAIVERLLAISGEDALTIDRKMMEPVTTRLLSRILILSNELPRLSESSGALSNRFVIWRMSKTFLGKENTKLTDTLLAERPSILLWAIAGWKRLQVERGFTQPANGNELRDDLEDITSPVRAFVRERCAVGAGGQIAVSDLFGAWRRWCEGKNREPGTEQTFGRDLRSAMPELKRTQPRTGEERYRAYEGISLA